VGSTQRSLLEGFTAVEFPTLEDVASLPRGPGGFVYVISWTRAGNPEVPFYVGQTRRLSDRMWDYCEASFTACTDFRVGKAIQYLGERGCRIILRYKATENRHEEEYKLVRELLVIGTRLLNQVPAYDYRNANTCEAEECRFIRRFSDLLIGPQGADTAATPPPQI